jgi:hypothetical protein
MRYKGDRIVVNLGTDYYVDTWDKIILFDDNETCDITSVKNISSSYTLSLEEEPTYVYIPTVNSAPQQSYNQTSSDTETLEKNLFTTTDTTLVNKLKGRILLQVQEHGEGWYVDPTTKKKYYMKDGQTAYEMMRKFGLGITDNDLNKISVEGSKEIGDKNLVERLKGKILLQIQQNGEAWYVNPADGKRYYLKNGDEAYRIMRILSLGITNLDLRKIPVGDIKEIKK